MTTDKIYQQNSEEKPFRFNEDVAKVFPDMLQRSVPGYAATIEAIGSLAARYVLADTNCYDLGCSLGAATIAMRQGIQSPGCRIVAVDTAPAMTERCREIIAEDDRLFAPITSVDVIEGDIRDIEVTNGSMVVLNYTLQFLSMDDRDSLMRSIHAGLNDGGLLVCSCSPKRWSTKTRKWNNCWLICTTSINGAMTTARWKSAANVLRLRMY